MSSNEMKLGWIATMKQQLKSDDARGSLRGQIGGAYFSLGDRDEAEVWFLEAARHAEWSEMALTPLSWAKMAVRANPGSSAAWAEYSRQWRRLGLPGNPDLVEPM